MDDDIYVMLLVWKDGTDRYQDNTESFLKESFANTVVKNKNPFFRFTQKLNMTRFARSSHVTRSRRHQCMLLLCQHKCAYSEIDEFALKYVFFTALTPMA